MTIPQITSKNKIEVLLSLEQEKIFKIHSYYTVNLDDRFLFHNTSFGVDPGTKNLGVACVSGSLANLYEMELVQRDNTTQIIKSIWSMMDSINFRPKIITIEGASYNDKFGQAKLEAVRSAFSGWVIKSERKIEIEIIPPSTIRKVVFGSAKIKNPWVEQGIPDNAAAALACALFPIMKEKGKQT